jgi:uncharacterized phosphosugar-binding protein
VTEQLLGLDGRTFAAEAVRKIEELASSQADAISAAADIVVSVARADGVLHAFGTGHSEACAMEIAGRAGGLVGTNKVSLRDLVFVGGADPTGVDPHLERDPATGRKLFDLVTPAPQDAFVVISNSGGNGSVVEFALAVKEAGLPLIAITSVAHSSGITSRHPSGKRLFELADVVIDNLAPYGDAILDLPGGGKACGISSVTSATAAQMMTAEALARLLADGGTPPIYLSANIPDADEHNLKLEDHYAGRIHRGPF